MNPLLKKAFEEGAEKAKQELDAKMKAALKRKLAPKHVGWKEEDLTPARKVGK